MLIRRRLTALALFALLAVVAAACGGGAGSDQAQSTPESRSFGDPSLLEDEPTISPEPAAASGGTTVKPKTGAAAATPVVTRAPSRTLPPARPNDNGGTGSNVRLYTQGTVPKLIIEMGAVTGKEPTQAALDFIKSSLTPILDKPEGIQFKLTSVFDATKESYTMDDVAKLEDEHRTLNSNTDAAVMYMLFLNGQIEGAAALGIAYRASSIVILTDQITQASTLSVSRASIERTTMLHEVGHLLALVNLGYKSPRDHADPSHPSHSKNKQSVMYWAVESISVAALLSGGPPDKFDADDLADLADFRNGRL